MITPTATTSYVCIQAFQQARDLLYQVEEASASAVLVSKKAVLAFEEVQYKTKACLCLIAITQQGGDNRCMHLQCTCTHPTSPLLAHSCRWHVWRWSS